MLKAQTQDQRGGGSGGVKGRGRGEASGYNTQPLGHRQGVQVATGGGGRTAPAVTHSVLKPLH